MVAIGEGSIKFLSISSSEENWDSFEPAAEARSEDERFYEEIEAPKFVDFTTPDHYRPDDRYWFCLRVGCNQKHEEEMDSETIYKNFILRVMTARSPNIRLRKALDRNASRLPTKCPLSAPPKTSKPRLAIMSSISKKTVDDKRGIIRPLFKPKTCSPKPKTPMLKTKPVAAKYLTTPRNRACLVNQSSFRSVQNPKPTTCDAPKSRVVAKALVFRSPKKSVKVKTSVELRTPISTLCEGMNKLKISSQKKRALVRSSKDSSSTFLTRQLSSHKVQRRPEGSHGSQNANSQSSTKSEVKLKLRQNVLQRKLGNDHVDSSKENGSYKIKKQLSNKSVAGDEVEESNNGGLSLYSDSASVDNSNREKREADSNGGKQKISIESCGELVNHLITTVDEMEDHEHEFMDNDDKENAIASDENRMQKDTKPSGRKVFGMRGECSEMKKEVSQAERKSLKEGLISSGLSTKFKKPKPTNPKPFRLRTDERGVLKEATSETRTDSPARQCATASLRTPTRKLPKKQGSGIQVVLKEATSETRTDSPARQCATASLRTPTRKLPKKQGSGIQVVLKEATSETRTDSPARQCATASLRTPTRKLPKKQGSGIQVVLKEATSETRTDSPARQCATANLRSPTWKLPKKQGSGIQVVLKEATSERRTDPPARQCATANLRSPTWKLPKKQGSGIQKRNVSVDTKLSNGLERFKEATPMTPESNKRQELKQMSSPHESSTAIQRLERFRKMNSPIQKCTIKLQEPCSTKQEMNSFLIPGLKLDVIHEVSPEVPKLKMTGKPETNDSADRTASRPSSCGKRPTTVAREPKFHSTHTPRSCIKKLTIMSS